MSDTNEELLLAAARSIGMDDATYQHGGSWMEVRYGFPEAIWSAKARRHYWNPLCDPADAFQLAVAHGMFGRPDMQHFLALERFANQGQNDLVAHCKAITRAAASLAKENGND